MLLQIQPYELTVIFRPGKEIPVPDTLSRLYLQSQDESLQKEIESYVLIPISLARLLQLKKETLLDPILACLADIIKSGWPSTKAQTPSLIAQYFSSKHELTVIDGIILKGDRLVIPKILRPDILHNIHASHLGIEKTKQRARTIVYWPEMTESIEEYIKRCPACQAYQRNNQKESLQPHGIPNHPWEHVGIDMFYLEGSHFLVTVDYYNRFFEVDQIGTAASSHQVISRLKDYFARHWIPRIITSDNGPHFNSLIFQDFTNRWSIEHRTSSPYHAQSNGLAEKAVGIAKNMIKKTRFCRSEMSNALLEYRNTPVDGMASPAQLLTSRNFQSTIPCTLEHLTSKIVPKCEFVESRLECQLRQQKYYNRHSKDLQEQKQGQSVEAQIQGKSWEPAFVLHKHELLRSYVVQTLRYESISSKPKIPENVPR